MNYNARLETLIHKHQLDMHHPGFCDSMAARELIIKLLGKFCGGGKLLFLSDKRGDFEHIRVLMPQGVEYVSYLYDNSTLQTLSRSAEEIRRIEADVVLLIAYKDHVRVSAELARNHVKAIDLYDCLAENGLEIHREFYQADDSGAYFDQYGNRSEDTVYECGYGMLFYDKRKYRLAESEAVRRYYLEKVIFDCFYLRDFVNGYAFIEEYAAAWPESGERYLHFREETEALLQDIRRGIERKEKKDILLYWIDALSYGEDKDMPYLRSLDSECIVFQNAFAVTDTTGGAASAIFCREMPLESRRFQRRELIGDCYLTDYLRREGWQFRFYGSGDIFSHQHVRNVTGDKCISVVSSINYWLALCEMAEETAPALRIVHVMGCHTPFLSGDMTAEEYLPMQALFCRQDADTEKKRFAQRKDAMAYEDRLLAFYDQMVSAAGKIYFSDHGCHERCAGNFAELHHTMLKVKSERLGAGEERRVFSLIRLGSLIQYLISGDERHYADTACGHALICGLPYYSKEFVKAGYHPMRFHEGTSLGFWGLVKENAALFLFNSGTEVCYEIRGSRAFLMGPNRSAGIRQELKHLLLPEITPIDVNGMEKFKYSRVLFDLYERLKEKDNLEEQRERAIDFCRELMRGIPAGEKAAVRGGGEDAVMFLDCLTQEQLERISCIIDSNPQCAANNWGIPVIPADGIEQGEKLTVLIASSRYHAEMAEELKSHDNITIVDIYKCMRKSGFPQGKILSEMLCKTRVTCREEAFTPIDWEAAGKEK